MEKMKYNDKVYKKINGCWYDNTNMKVPRVLQKELDSKEFENMNVEDKSVYEIVQLANDYKDGKNYYRAKTMYEKIFDKLKIDEIRSLAARLTSCYRGIGEPENAIDFFHMIYEKYDSKILSAPLCTSLAAAYMDLDDEMNANKMIQEAKALCGCYHSQELDNVVLRHLTKFA